MSIAQQLKPCQCGYEGVLIGTDYGLFYSLQCPECKTAVEAFTFLGLGEAWNKAQQNNEQEADE